MSNVGRQTGEQNTMLAFAFMVYMNRPYGSSARKVAKDVWRLYPKGYCCFNSFYQSFWRLATNYINNAASGKKIFAVSPAKIKGLARVAKIICFSIVDMGL